MSSGGSSDAASISNPRRSRTELLYSTRLRRCSAGRPGFGAAAAARSIAASRPLANASSCSLSGRFAPAGGIMPARTLRATFSQVATSAVGRAASRPDRTRSPRFRRSLWHPTQVLLHQCLGGVLGRRGADVLTGGRRRPRNEERQREQRAPDDRQSRAARHRYRQRPQACRSSATKRCARAKGSSCQSRLASCGDAIAFYVAAGPISDVHPDDTRGAQWAESSTRSAACILRNCSSLSQRGAPARAVDPHARAAAAALKIGSAWLGPAGPAQAGAGSPSA